MTRVLSTRLIAGALTLGFALRPCVGQGDTLDELDASVEAWRLEAARSLLQTTKIDADVTPRAQYLKGKLLFYEGECTSALVAIRKAIEGARHEMDWKLLRDRAEATEAVYNGLETRMGEGDRFLFRYAGAADSLLVPYADEALARQFKALAGMFGDTPRRPIEVLLLPDVQSFSAVSGLTPEQIERTGTVGVTKYGRVMVLTPRRLVTGYPWIDTLAHELTHFFITRVSNNRAPIWLQEAIAKLLERRWRSRDAQDLSPEEAYLLDRAVKEGRIISLKRFHPSVAYLSDQEEAALAYAQSLSFARYLNERLGEEWAPLLMSSLARGQSLDQGFLEIAKADLKRLHLSWRQEASAKRHTPVPVVAIMKRRFRRGEVVGVDAATVTATEVRRHLRIGDLLRLRGHQEAAVQEFEKAKKLSVSPSPDITDRLAACLLDLGKTKDTVELLEPIVQLYPFHSTSLVQLGRALAKEKRAFEAMKAYSRANAVNPFQAEVHCALAELHESAGHVKEAERERENCRLAALIAGRPDEIDEKQK